MAFCAWCGNSVSAVTYAACPRCGNPTNGSQRVAGGRDGSKTAGIVIGIAVGGLVLIAVIGILAAIAIPNLLTAQQRSRQKRSMEDMRRIATAVESYAADEDKYPEVPMSGLSAVLVPKYASKLPSVDGWGKEFRYECWPAGECTSYGIATAGADQTFEYESLQEYSSTRTDDFDSDVVFADGSFVQYPERMAP